MNYPGLALLDKYLQPIEGADILIDIERYYFKSRDTRVFQDFTLYAGRTTKDNPKKDHLFLVSNGMLVVPIAIRRRPPTDFVEQEENWWSKIKVEPVKSDILHGGGGIEVKLTRGEPAADFKDFLHKNPSVQLVAGKNMHFFESSDRGTFVEVWPHSNHTYAKVNLFVESFSTFGDYKLEHATLSETPNFCEERGAKRQHLPVKGPQNRGTGCCADMSLSDGRRIKLGISHFIVRPLTYLHQFYVFIPEEPFSVLAISDPFCLGRMKESDLNSMEHWISSADHSLQPRQTQIAQDENIDT